jgi:hypothetical protein
VCSPSLYFSETFVRDIRAREFLILVSVLMHLGNRMLSVNDCTSENVFSQCHLASLCSIQLIRPTHSAKQRVEMSNQAMPGTSRKNVDPYARSK